MKFENLWMNFINDWLISNLYTDKHYQIAYWSRIYLVLYHIHINIFNSRQPSKTIKNLGGSEEGGTFSNFKKKLRIAKYLNSMPPNEIESYKSTQPGWLFWLVRRTPSSLKKVRNRHWCLSPNLIFSSSFAGNFC